MIHVTPNELAYMAIAGFGAMQKLGELTELIKLVDELQPKNIIEIGVGKGGTSFCWSKISGVKRIVGVDLPNGPWGGGPDASTIGYIKENSLGEYCFIPGDSRDKEIQRQVYNLTSQCDFLLIDGDHSYDGVKTDFLTFSPFVKKGGLIAFHDIHDHPPETKCEVKKFWDEVKLSNTWTEVITEPDAKWGGIGLIKV